MSKCNRQTSLFGFDKEERGERREESTAQSTKPQDLRPNTQAQNLQISKSPNLQIPQPGQTVWAIDAHSLIHQVFHALPEMSSPRGEPVGAVFGFTRDMIYLLEEKRPDYLFCAFDLPGKTFRHSLYESYKEQRPEMPDDLAPQIASIRRVLAALGIPSVGCEGFEADDVLATIARLTEELGGECFLVSGDKDCRQLITDRVRLFNIRRNEVFDASRLMEEWGITPAQVVDFQALVGDSVDNVPGVPLIGPKFARQLLEQFGTLESVLEHADEVPGAKRKENLKKFREQALLSRQLVRLDAHVPLELDWSAGRVGRIDLDAALDLFREFGFRSLGQKVSALARASGQWPVASGQREQIEMRRERETTNLPSPACGRGAGGEGIQPHSQSALLPTISQVERGQNTLPFVVHLVDSPEAFVDFLSQLQGQKCFSLDTETTDVRPRWAELVGMSFAWNDAEAWYLPLKSPPGQKRLDSATVFAALKPILENPAVEKIGQNLKYDMIVLRAAGIELAGVAFDTMVASYLLEAGQRNHNLDELARVHLGHETIKISELIGRGKQQRRMDEVDVLRVADYAAEDAWVPWRLRPILAGQLADAGLNELMNQLELPLIDVLAEMEYLGVKVDVQRLKELSLRYGRRMEELEAEIHDMAGRRLNIASPKQLQELLFGELKLPITKRTSTNEPSTDADVMEELAPLHPLPAKILLYRQYAKLKGTYVDALPEMLCPATGRIHASFNQVVAATGRLSSSEPNLQNIPIRSEEGREIRSAFVPGEPGWLLMTADYSQIELRVLAHFSGDRRLAEAFARDEDIHARVASQVAGVELSQVTPEMRRAAKAVNFGVIYGQGPAGLARGLGIKQEEAARFIDSYFEGYPGIEEFLVRALAECRQTGYAKTILGRRRAISGVRQGAGRQRNLAERTAVNTVIQGSAADLIKRAMISIRRRLRTERLSARMLLQIHDELVFEVPADQLHDLAKLATEEMVAAWPLNVPLKVDVKAGTNWADTEVVESG
jgi:DNA polymerase-1